MAVSEIKLQPIDQVKKAILNLVSSLYPFHHISIDSIKSDHKLSSYFDDTQMRILINNLIGHLLIAKNIGAVIKFIHCYQFSSEV